MKTMTRDEFLASLPAVQTYVPASAEEAAALAYAFPNVEPGARPFGQRVLVQIRATRRRTKGGLYVPGESQDTEKWNTGVAQVIMLGPLAFRKRDTLQLWGEGAWVQAGDYVRAPRFGGDRWEVEIPDEEAIAERESALANISAEIESTPGNSDRYQRLYQERKQLQNAPSPLLIQFAFFNDFELIGRVTTNPVDVRVYI